MVRPLVIAALLIGVTACGGGSTPAASVSPRPTLSASEQAQLASLEGRPMKLPAVGANGACPETAMTQIAPYKDQNETVALYGNGPVYGAGGSGFTTRVNAFYNVSYLGDPTLSGLVLVRIATLDGLHKGVFTGPYGAGPVTGTDTIDGGQVALYGEVALPVAKAPKDATLLPGWVSWPVRQGVDISWKCVGIQIDSQSATEVIVVAA